MATQVQLRRGTTAQHASFTGAPGEITVDTTKKTVIVHDGVTEGGSPLAKEADMVRKNAEEQITAVWSFQGGLITSHINGGPLDGSRQKFIAGNFTQNPWQRGTSFTVTTSGTYVADRWRVDFDGSANITVDRVALATPQVINGEWCSHGLRFTVNSKSSNTFIRLSQRIEYVRTLTTLPATLQTAIQGSTSIAVPVQARQHFGTGGSPSADVVTPLASSLSVTTGLQLLTTGLTVPTISGKTLGTASNDYLGIEYSLINVPVGGHVVIPIAGIEPGAVATPFGFRLPQQELALCQRYFEIARFAGFYMPGTNATAIYQSVPLQVEKRAVPSITMPSATSACWDSAGGNVTPSTWTTRAIDTKAFGIQAGHSSALGGIKENSFPVSAEL